MARIAERMENRVSLAEAGALVVLSDWLDDSFALHPRMQEAALDALSSICKDNVNFSQDVVGHSTNGHEKVTTILFKMIRDKRPAMRLSSATWLNHFNP